MSVEFPMHFPGELAGMARQAAGKEERVFSAC